MALMPPHRAIARAGCGLSRKIAVTSSLSRRDGKLLVMCMPAISLVTHKDRLCVAHKTFLFANHHTAIEYAILVR